MSSCSIHEVGSPYHNCRLPTFLLRNLPQYGRHWLVPQDRHMKSLAKSIKRSLRFLKLLMTTTCVKKTDIRTENKYFYTESLTPPGEWRVHGCTNKWLAQMTFKSFRKWTIAQYTVTAFIVTIPHGCIINPFMCKK